MSELYPVGVKDFKALVTGGYRFADKTMIIDDICHKPGCTTVFSRPRGFGKTLALSMLDRFFSIRYRGEEDIFAGTRISECHECDGHRNRYPVIKLDLSGIDGSTQESMMEGLKSAVADMVRDFRGYGLDSELTDARQETLDKLENGRATYTEMTCAVRNIGQTLERFCGEKPVILVDGYDDCILSPKDLAGFEDAAKTLGRFMEMSFKINTNFKFIVVMGVTTPSHSGVGSYLTTTKCDTFDPRSRDFFGFTEEEVAGLLDGAEGAADRIADIRERHGGFRFGDSEFFEPAGTIRCLAGECADKRRCDAVPEWLVSSVDTGTLMALRDLAEDRIQSIESAIDGHRIQDMFGEGLVPPKAYMHLVMSGCLRAVCLKEDDRCRRVCKLSVTNTDAREAFAGLIAYAEDLVKEAPSTLKEASVPEAETASPKMPL